MLLKLRRRAALALTASVSLLVASCGGGITTTVTSCVLSINSSNPSSGVSIAVTSGQDNHTSYETTSFSRTYTSGSPFTLTAPALVGINTFSSWSGCRSTASVTCAVILTADTTVSANYITPAITTPMVKVTPSLSSFTTRQALSVTVAVVGPTGQATPTGTVTLDSGSYLSAAATLSSGSAQINIPPNVLDAGTDTLEADFTPDAVTAPIYTQASGTAFVTVTVPPTVSPTVIVTTSSYSISTRQAINVRVAVIGSSGNPMPTGTVTLASGNYASAPATLSFSGATILIPAGSLAAGNDTLVAHYVPDSSSSSYYSAANGQSLPVSVPTAITVDQSSIGPAVSSRLLGMNMGYWYDPSTPAIVPAFQAAGIKSIRWPGGSAANAYHWATNTLCFGQQTLPTDAFDTFIGELIQPGNFDLALSANYSTDASCTGPGEPAEAAAWVQNAKTHGGHVSHVTVGNENWGAWEPDLHPVPRDPATYANATANGYYPLIKAADPNVLVGVGVNPYNPVPWDSIILSTARYDFVEYHFYPQGPGAENDTFLVHQAAQQLTSAIDTIKVELAAAGAPATPIFIGEIGSVYNDPGKQSTSITQALYAGQVLGEMMNQGVSQAAWWIGFGGCLSDPTVQNFSSSLYGWQNFGGYMVFSDGLPEPACDGPAIPKIPAGTLLPTARAFQLFSDIAIDGEAVLTASVAGDTMNIRTYAATHSGGVAIVVFNLNEFASETVEIALSNQSAISGVTVETYSRAIYDQSMNNVWAGPTSTDLGSPSLPLPLTLDPWSMNIILVK